MPFIIKDGRFLARIFHVETSAPAPLGNLLAFLYQDRGSPPDEWLTHYRIRYYVDDKIGQESSDPRSEYGLRFTGSLEQARLKALEVFQTVSFAGGGHPVHEAIVDSADVEVVSQIIAKQSFIHSYTETSSGQVIRA